MSISRSDAMRIMSATVSLKMRETALVQEVVQRTAEKDHWETAVTNSKDHAHEAEARGYYWLAESQLMYAERELRFVRAVIKELEV